MKNRLRFSLISGLCLISTAFLFNNCSGQFQTTDELEYSQELPLSSETPDTPAVDPGGSSDPVVPPVVVKPPQDSQPTIPQPAPAPIEPIEMTNNPAWMAGKNLNEWIEIPNTAGAGGSALFAFSGIALKESNSELIVAAAGGHLDSSDNRVVSLVLETNQPKWQLRIPSSQVPKMDVTHYPDGTPSSRHTYQHNFYIASLNRVFMFGNRGAYGTPFHFLNVDAFDLTTNQWDPPNTWAPLPASSGFGSIRIPGTDNVFTHNLHMWSASEALAALKSGQPSNTSVWSTPIQTRTKTPTRWPMAFDKARNQIFTLQWADGMGYSTQQVFSSLVDLKTGVQSEITFTRNEVFDLFVAEKPTYSAMDYDPAHDRFLFYSGIGAAAGRIYEIKPVAGKVWEMQLFATTANSLKPSPTPGAGINANFKYIPRLKGFVLIPNNKSNVLFMRTSQ